jgi:hypothetical protein
MTMSTQLSVADAYTYAQLQMAAEALYGDDAAINANLTPGDEVTDPDRLTVKMLTIGNEHASKFTDAQAQDFVSHWALVDHLSDTSTGFSGTLFQNKVTHEYVLSLRSTEFIDDAVRDNQATNAEEIAAHGWAFGQIDDLRNWYESTLKAEIGDGKLSVTGYSLGAHLATAFNLMYGQKVSQVVSFNSAGVGTLGLANDSHWRVAA